MRKNGHPLKTINHHISNQPLSKHYNIKLDLVDPDLALPYSVFKEVDLLVCWSILLKIDGDL